MQAAMQGIYCHLDHWQRTVCKMIGFQGFWRFNAIYFSIGAFFVNILGGKLAPLNSKEI
eukprot:SAG31_NODE_232_length_19710_cov_17.109581_12_plen_59_part_00